MQIGLNSYEYDTTFPHGSSLKLLALSLGLVYVYKYRLIVTHKDATQRSVVELNSVFFCTRLQHLSHHITCFILSIIINATMFIITFTAFILIVSIIRKLLITNYLTCS